MATLFGSSLKLTDIFADGQDGAILDGPGIPATLEINGTRFVYVPSDDDDAVSIFSIDGTGTLIFLNAITDTAGVTLDGARQAEAFYVDGNPFLAVTGINDDGVTIYALSDSAPLATFVDRAFDADNAAWGDSLKNGRR